MAHRLVLRELSRYQLGTFADIIHRNAVLHPDAEAFVYDTHRISFKTFNARVNRMVHALYDLGVAKGEVLGIVSWNRMEYLDVFGAAMKGGFILAHFSPRLGIDELIHLIQDAAPTVLFIDDEFMDAVETVIHRFPQLKGVMAFGHARGAVFDYKALVKNRSIEEPEPSVSPDDPLVIFYTSGTTGIPRGAIYTHRQKMENTSIKALDLALEFGDRHLVVLPMFHIGGDSHIWPFFLVGGCNVIMTQKSFDPVQALQTIQDYQITDVHIVPTQLVALLNLSDIHRYDLKSLKRIWYAASPMPVEVLKRGLEIFGPILLQGYGQTESGPHTTMLSKSAHQVLDREPEAHKVLASCGQPSLGVHMRIVDEAGNDVLPDEIGEIIVRSQRIMTGYWHRPEETRKTIKDGWLWTGDMGYYDERGFIYVADRKSYMIISGGENVYPKEVEDVLYAHPAVSEATVIGIPDPYWVERVHAVVVLNEGAKASEQEMLSFCRDRIAHFKAPKGVDFVQSLPKSPQGKILKSEIRKQYIRGADQGGKDIP